MALYAGTCECHLCWKPQTAFLSGSVGVSLPGFRWASEHVMSIWPDPPPPPPSHHPSSVSALRTAHCQGHRISMHERKRTIFAEHKPNANGKGHCGHRAYTACSVARLKGAFWFASLLAACVKVLRLKMFPTDLNVSFVVHSGHYIQTLYVKEYLTESLDAYL